LRVRSLVGDWSISLGKEYVALALSYQFTGEPGGCLLLETEAEGGPYWFPARELEVVDGTMARSWVAAVIDGRLLIAPRPWTRPEFWDDLHDPGSLRVLGAVPHNTMTARHEYREERDRLLREDSR
jgi:hypothetical protein